jgi:hypothetical protein
LGVRGLQPQVIDTKAHITEQGKFE